MTPCLVQFLGRDIKIDPGQYFSVNDIRYRLNWSGLRTV